MAQMVKDIPAMQKTRVRSLDQEDSLEKGQATHSSILAWRIPWTEEPGGFKSFWGVFPGGSDGKESALNAGDLGSIPWLGRFPWRRAWQPTPVFFPGESLWTEDPGGLQSTGLQRVRHD